MEAFAKLKYLAKNRKAISFGAHHWIISACLVTLLIAPSIAEARPSFRSVRENAFSPKEARTQHYKKTTELPFEKYKHHRFGLTTEIPKDWNSHMVTTNQPLAQIASDLMIFWPKAKDFHGELSIGVLDNTQAAAGRAAQEQFDLYMRQPSGIFVRVYNNDPDLPELREYVLLNARTMNVRGIASQEENYGFILQSIDWRVREVRVPTSFGTVVLRYRNTKEHFDQELFVFDHFVESLSIPGTQKNSGSSSSIKKQSAAERAKERRVRGK